MLKYEVPEVYDLVLRLTPKSRRKAPPAEIVRAVCAASPDPSLRKPKFFRWLAEYERTGVCCRRPKVPSPERMVFYHALRRRKLECRINEMERENLLTDILGDEVNSTEQ